MNKDAAKFMSKLAELKRLYGVKVHSKDRSWTKFWRFVEVAFAILTFGKIRDASTRYTTTIGNQIFFPSGWRIEDASFKDYVTLCHEGDHVHQCYSIGSENIVWGTILMIFLYALIPFPIGLAWFRYKFEREAYVTSWKTWKEGGHIADIEHYVNVLTGPAYFWTWPFKKSVRAYFEAHCQ